MKLKTIKHILMAVMLMASACATVSAGSVTPRNVDVFVSDSNLCVSADLELDGLRLQSDRQLFITPVVRLSDTVRMELPSVLVSGRNMHLSYIRGSLKRFKEFRNRHILVEERRNNGKPQSIPYIWRTTLQDWMGSPTANVAFVIDSCGCGVLSGQQIADAVPVKFPVTEIPELVTDMQAIMISPTFSEPPVDIHQGKARVQFEVDKTELHVGPYVCRNGQLIDNRTQLAIIDDSVRYALTDPNVELAGISICGYASPESSYLHNEKLADGRSHALAEYLAEHFNLPREAVTYTFVAENWDGFREMVQKSDEITEDQRESLLRLIDAPASTPADFDRKERTLKTDSKFKQLYNKKILPDWFPHLRATTFAVHTRLKPMTDEELVAVMATAPEKMSLSQMFRVARLYPDDSEEFRQAINTALRIYPDDPTAILNAAAAEVSRGEYDKAKLLLVKAGESPEVNNLLGIIATSEGNYELARSYFLKAAETLPEAKENLKLLP